MATFLVFLGLCVIVYIISFNTRDKSKDYQFNQAVASRNETSFHSYLIDIIDSKIKQAEINNLLVKRELIKLKASLLNDIDNICKDYRIDKYSARLTINICLDSRISEY